MQAKYPLALLPNLLSLPWHYHPICQAFYFWKTRQGFAKHGLFLTLKTLVTNIHFNSNVTAPALCASASLLPAHVAPAQRLVGLHWPEHTCLPYPEPDWCGLPPSSAAQQPASEHGTWVRGAVYLYLFFDHSGSVDSEALFSCFMV